MEEKDKKERRISGRSTGYPGFSLSECVEGAQKIKQELGNGGSSRELIAKAMGYSGLTGASGTKISACVHFGLLDRVGNVYTLSELSSRILTPLTDSERERAVMEAMRTPALYSKLIDEYDGKALPGMLDNILVRNHKIIENSAKRAAEIFKESLEYAGMLRNGVVCASRDDVSKGSESGNDVAKNETNRTACNRPVEAKPFLGGDCFVVELPDTGARLVMPKDFSYEVSTGELAEEIKALKGKLQEIASKRKEKIDEAICED